MYYYIFDVKKCRKRSQVEDIKACLGGLGISGEFTYPTAAQTAEELVDLGLSKKYSTIVAIGGDEIINAVSLKLLGRKEAMGVIPLEASPEIENLIGVQNWREGAEALRYRKISEVRLGLTASGGSFLTHLSLDIHAPTEVTIEFRDFLVQARIDNLTIANYYPSIPKIDDEYLNILITSHDPAKDSFIKRVTSLFGQETISDEKLTSLIRARSLRIFTKTPIGLANAGRAIAKTPQLVESSDEVLRLITARKSPYFGD